MDLTFNGGTPRQRRWVEDAIDNCTFPLDKLQVPVTVQWGDFPGNVDLRHPYMVTSIQGNSFFITIVPWADDANAPGNRGLPNPAADIYTFYKQSFVHELGHVVTYCTIDPGNLNTSPKIGAACALFWHGEVDSGTGRRSGTAADWDAPALAWGDEIREAVAECFKLAFYNGRMLFTNRTNWKIDTQEWSQLMKLFSFITFPFRETFATYFSKTVYDPVAKQLGAYPVAPAPQTSDPTQFFIANGEFVLPAVGKPAFLEQLTLTGPEDISPVGIASCRIDEVDMPAGDLQSLRVFVGATGVGSAGAPPALAEVTFTTQNTSQHPSGPNNAFPGIEVQAVPGGHLAPANTGGLLSPLYIAGQIPTPCWLVCRVTLIDVTAELWLGNPNGAEGGLPFASASIAFNAAGGGGNPGTPLAACLGIEASGDPVTYGTPGASISDWRWAGAPVDVAAPFPFAPPAGDIGPGPAAGGVILVGTAR